MRSSSGPQGVRRGVCPRPRAAGIEVRVEVEPRTVHGYINEHSFRAAQREIERIVNWITRECQELVVLATLEAAHQPLHMELRGR